MHTAQHSRISKRELLARVAVRSHMPVTTVSEIYEALLGELTDAVGRGETVVLTRFGRFYRQAHKGHQVRFGQHAVGDYAVLKFSASRVVNRDLGQRRTDDG